MSWLSYIINKFKIWFSDSIIVWDKCPIKNEKFQQMAEGTIQIAHINLLDDNYYDGMAIYDSIISDALEYAFKDFIAPLWQIPDNKKEEYFDIMYENLLTMMETKYGYVII